jgi:hypothetical protein
MAKRIIPLFAVIFVCTKAYAYTDDDSIDSQFSFYMILAGVALLLIGTLVSNGKALEGAGKVICGAGLFIGGFGLLGIALIILQWALKAAARLALFALAIVAIGYVLRLIYVWIFGNKDS